MRLAPALPILLALVAVPAAAGPGFWTSTGPDGGWAARVQVDPSDPAWVYVATFGGLYRSQDGGLNYTRIENGLSRNSLGRIPFAIDRQQPQRLWAVSATGGFAVSTDRGASWSATGYTLPATDCVQHITDGAGPQEVFIATCGGSVLRSTDGGASFVAPTTLPTGSAGALWLAQDSADPNRLLAAIISFPASAGAVWRSTDRGATWTVATGSTTTNFCTRVAWAGAGIAYAACGDGFLKSTDAGATWSLVANVPFVDAIVVSPANPNVVFASGVGAMRLDIAGNSATVTPLDAGLQPIPSYGRPVSGEDLAIHPSFPGTAGLWLASVAGFYRSSDAGATWVPSQVGLRAQVVRAIAPHPAPAVSAASRRILAGVFHDTSANFPLFRSDDNGATWSTNPSAGPRAAGLRAIAIDPTTTGAVASTRVYAAGLAQADPVSGLNGGLFRSLDGGATWATIDDGLPATGTPPNRRIGVVRAIVLDPRSCATPPASGPCTSGPLRTAYAGGSGRSRVAPAPAGRGWRVLKTTNLDAPGGPTWTDIDGLPQPTANETLLVLALAIDPVTPQTVYAATYITLLGGATTPTQPNGVFKSTDGGATWSNATNGLPRLLGSATTAWDVVALAHHPTTSGTLWAVATPLGDSASPAASRIYKSTDGAATWTRADTGIPANADLRALIVDPAAPDVLYAGGIGSPGNPGGVFRSDDGGATWRSISIGLPSAAVLTLALDPVDRSVLHAGTSSSIWSLTQLPDADGDGAPDAQENAAPNGGDGNGDGAPDALQGDVGSTIVLDNRPPRRGSGPCNGGFTTDVVAGTCPRAYDVSGIDAARFGRDPIAGASGRAYAYPLGLLRIELPGCSSAEVAVTFHAAGDDPAACPDFSDSQWSFRYFGPQQPGVDATLGWHAFAARATRTGARTWRLRLDANQFGSYRPAGEGILFIGGPALDGDRVFRDGFED